MKTKGCGEVMPAEVVEGSKFIAFYIDEIMYKEDSDVQRYLNGIQDKEFKIADWHKYYEMKENKLPRLVDVLFSGLLPDLDVKGLIKRPSYEGIRKVFQLLIKVMQKPENVNISKILPILKKSQPEFAAQFRWIVYNVISFINYKMPINLLYKKAKEGDDDALFKLVRIDTTAINFDFAPERVKKVDITNDTCFKTRWSYILKEPKISTKCKRVASILIGALLYLLGKRDKRYELTWEQVCGFLYHNDIADESLTSTDLRKSVQKMSKM